MIYFNRINCVLMELNFNENIFTFAAVSCSQRYPYELYLINLCCRFYDKLVRNIQRYLQDDFRRFFLKYWIFLRWKTLKTLSSLFMNVRVNENVCDRRVKATKISTNIRTFQFYPIRIFFLCKQIFSFIVQSSLVELTNWKYN